MEHTLTIDSILREERSGSITVNFNGKSIGSDQKATVAVEIPGLSEFVNTGIKVHQSPQYIELWFSDNIQKAQDLKGLITISGVANSNLNFKTNNNVVKVFSTKRLKGKNTLKINKSLRSTEGSYLKKSYALNFTMRSELPKVHFLGTGVILPKGNGNKLAFKTMNLNAVTLTAYRVYDHNILQFFQRNSLSGDYYFNSVSNPIWRKKIAFNADEKSHNKWRTQAFNLEELFGKYPGELFRFKLDFRPEQIDYPCSEGYLLDIPPELTEEELLNGVVSKAASWDYYSGKWQEYRDNRENPCHSAYYSSRFHDTHVSRNILASNLGVIAKRGSDGTMQVVVTDLNTARPISNADVEIYNFQQHQIKKGRTNSQGMVDLALKQKPYMVVAKKGKDVGYVRLIDGEALSVSRFDVGGYAVEKGVKAFVYGERGVWRPGDSLFLSVVVENESATLPENYPVKMNLINPKGQIVLRKKSTEGVNGVYTFKCVTEDDAPTGRWKATFTIGGASFSKVLRIEAVKPNRLKVLIDLGTDMLEESDGEITGTLSSRWLHGAIASGLKAEVTVQLKEKQTRFEKFTGYQFDDASRTFEGEKVALFEGKLNDKGEVAISGDLTVEENTAGMLKAEFTTKVFEPGGSYSIDQFTLPYSPYTSYVGMQPPEGDGYRGMLWLDSTHTLNLVNVDSKGNHTTGRRDVNLKIYKLNWRWWWDRSGNELANFFNDNSRTPLFEAEETISNGRGSVDFKIDGQNWGRFLIKVCDAKSGHCASIVKYMDSPWWRSRSSSGNKGGVEDLNFSADKEEYTVGDSAVLSIPTPSKGTILISLEDGKSIQKSFWVDAEFGTTTVSIPLTKKMTPTTYVSALLLQPHNQTENSLPMRMFGVLPLKVVDPHTVLKPSIVAPKTFEPQSNSSITVSETNGKPMTYTLAIVDEGLLDLTRYKTPDPWNYFYAKEALGVKTWDLYKYVIGAEKYAIEKQFAIGGGEDGDAKKQPKAKRFPPMVSYYGPFTLQAGAEKQHPIVIPEYIGSVRVMVVASNSNGSYGSVEQAVPVRKPLMVLGTLPRVLGPSEKVKLPITLFAMDEKIKTIDLTVTLSDLFKGTKILKKTLPVTKVGEQMVMFDLETEQNTGIAKVDIVAKSGSVNATHSISLDVRAPNVKQHAVVTKIVAKQQSYSDSITLKGVQAERSAILEVSTIPPINLEKRLRYLIRYPHGCIEQTTSGMFPQIYLKNLMELKEQAQKEIQNNVKAGITRIGSMQLNNGGFGYWPGADHVSKWGSNYAGHFIVEARKQGYYVPSDMYNKWVSYQKKEARQWSGSDYNTRYQAYRLYTLALAGSPSMGAMNRLKGNKDLTTTSQWLLAAAYQLAGQQDAAADVLKGLTLEVGHYREFGRSYGSHFRDKAMILNALTIMGDRERGVPLVKQLSKRLSSQHWMSTQETAYSLMAIASFVAGSEEGIAKVLTYSIDVPGKDPIEINTGGLIAQTTLPLSADGTVSYTLKNQSDGELFVSLVTAEVPLVDTRKAESSGISLYVSYVDKDGARVDPKKVTQGEEITMLVSVDNTSDLYYEELALTAIFPSGWEIYNDRINFDDNTKAAWDYQDIRDDRIYTYFDLRRGEDIAMSFTINASYAGTYYMPAFVVEAMYNDEVYARTEGSWVEVTAQKR